MQLAVGCKLTNSALSSYSLLHTQLSRYALKRTAGIVVQVPRVSGLFIPYVAKRTLCTNTRAASMSAWGRASWEVPGCMYASCSRVHVVANWLHWRLCCGIHIHVWHMWLISPLPGGDMMLGAHCGMTHICACHLVHALDCTAAQSSLQNLREQFNQSTTVVSCVRRFSSEDITARNTTELFVYWQVYSGRRSMPYRRDAKYAYR